MILDSGVGMQPVAINGLFGLFLPGAVGPAFADAEDLAEANSECWKRS
jgi:hypothetical protein